LTSLLTLRRRTTPFGVQNPSLLAAAIALDTGKILKKLPGFFDRTEDYL